MKLVNLNSKKSDDQPKTLRTLSGKECRHITGGGGRSCYYSYYGGSSTSYSNNKSN